MANINISTSPYATDALIASAFANWSNPTTYKFIGKFPYAIAIQGFTFQHNIYTTTGISLDTTYSSNFRILTIIEDTANLIVEFPLAWRIDTRVNLGQFKVYTLPEPVIVNAYTPIYYNISQQPTAGSNYPGVKIFYKEIGYSFSRNGTKFYSSANAVKRVNIINQISISDFTYSHYGYFGGGRAEADTSSVIRIDKVDFRTGITTANVSDLSLARRMMGGVSDKTTNGYFCGGVSSDSTALVTADKIVFSTDVVSANTASNLATARYVHGSVSDGSLYGYFTGGLPGPLTSTDKITFSSGTTAAETSSSISETRESFMMVSDSLLYGYLSGGITGGSVRASSERITFSTGIFNSNTATNLSLARSNNATISGPLAGYFLGGNSGAYTAISDKLTFSDGVTVAATSANLSLARYNVSGVGDGKYNGFACGGYSNSVVNTADKLIFSTDTTSAATSAKLSTVRMNTIAISDGSV